MSTDNARGLPIPAVGDDLAAWWADFAGRAGVITTVSSFAAAQSIVAQYPSLFTADHPGYFATDSNLWTFNGTAWRTLFTGPYAILRNRDADIVKATDTETTVGDWPTQYVNGLTVASGIITITQGGIYALQAGLSFAANNTGLRVLSLKVTSASGSTLQLDSDLDPQGSEGHTSSLRVGVTTPLAEGDKIFITTKQTSGGNLGIINSSQPMHLSAVWQVNS